MCVCTTPLQCTHTLLLFKSVPTLSELRVVEEDNSRSGNEDGQYLFLLYNRAVLVTQNNNETAHICYLLRFKQQAKRSDCRESCQKRVALTSGSNPILKFLAKLPIKCTKWCEILCEKSLQCVKSGGIKITSFISW